MPSNRFLPRRLTRLGVCLSLAGMALPGQAQTQAPTQVAALAPAAASAVDPRWQPSLDAFAAADRLRAPAPGGVVFVGSSSIRLWNDLETSFADQPVVIKRGFGGSQLLDCVKLVDRLVLPYQPRLVVVYAGENDIAEGASPQQVAERFVAFVQAVKDALPESRIAFVSIKPSPLRAHLIPAVREANERIEIYSQTEPRLDFIDVFSLMIDAQGQPRPELFSDDRLHLNAQGYSLWRQLIAQHLKG
ncbi:SGNH/GDSL hydrolase family protein [Hydrogenophaga sp.]|uniref:SGNH/GDSL hydrolase family protein n=1 Tax=Hydrogenophaga sp. TaxID=1904254 RepID=UPI0026154D58|nr:SGNH/GDSL hydrolase family protein [Hydrogenophaga sp.]MCW5654821.1 GDSL family lipase [Hydrogenophaga sp.]